MHALAPTPNPSLQVHVLPDKKCDGGWVSRLMPISLQEGIFLLLNIIYFDQKVVPQLWEYQQIISVMLV